MLRVVGKSVIPGMAVEVNPHIGIWRIQASWQIDGLTVRVSVRENPAIGFGRRWVFADSGTRQVER